MVYDSRAALNAATIQATDAQGSFAAYSSSGDAN
jgi:hypothetical protein